MAVYNVMLHSGDWTPLGRVREEDLRLEVAVRAIGVIASDDDSALIAFPAGLVCARSEAQRDHWAEQLRAAACAHGVSLIFGIDIVDDDGWAPLQRRPRSFAFACQRGQRLLWNAEARCERESIIGEGRCVKIDEDRVVVLVESEIFSRSVRRLVEHRRPELVVVLSHAGGTPRWTPALAALERFAPVLVVRQALPSRTRSWTHVPHGWMKEQLASDTLLTVQRLSPPPFGAAVKSVGD
jgi:hypothetical protein